ncbi:MAG: hypothetical protein QF366_05735 [Candidatus Poseidoniia archaeon]|jgi:hypothetical protein|nr:hypothetical protein [Candidatus Poseidoniia archaeon]MDP6847117.1 hypothetical protein [Candidatus Poseidoniia archaeon]MDP7007623.1 hypothetical protein [Candidatus Poseidoniia archaeon]|tara:strand:- start:591 stop:1097 length:507 start_codon:yes stop_codon:yes gene_type:complete
MDEPDIDGSLPGDEEEEEEQPVRRESEPAVRRQGTPPAPRSAPESASNWGDFSEGASSDAMREKLSLIAGAGFTTLLAYFYFFIYMVEKDMLQLAIVVTVLVAVSLWFYMRGAARMDPVRANFFAGVIGILALIVLWQGWDAAKQHLIISALLSAFSTFCFLKASELE